jgi:hypothetical protein
MRVKFKIFCFLNLENEQTNEGIVHILRNALWGRGSEHALRTISNKWGICRALRYVGGSKI